MNLVFRMPVPSRTENVASRSFAPLRWLEKAAPKAFKKSFIAAAVVAALGTLGLGSSATAAPGFYVSGSSLKDANGNDFYPRGVNNPHSWFDSDAYNALSGLSSRGANCIRIVWSSSLAPGRLDQILSRCEALRMIPMVESHSATGSDSATLLNDQARYWARSDVASVLKRHQRYVLINIANEWGSRATSDSAWRDAYKRAITTIRNAGIVTTLVIDGPNWGQNATAAQTYGQELLNYDPQHNLSFGVHMYGSWNTSSNITSAMATFKSKRLNLIIGEFGYNYNNGNNNLNSRVDHRVLMKACHDYGYGYLAWSTKGNNSENAWLDLTTNWSSLTWWGNEVFYGTHGIANVAKRASVFN